MPRRAVCVGLLLMNVLITVSSYPSHLVYTITRVPFLKEALKFPDVHWLTVLIGRNMPVNAFSGQWPVPGDKNHQSRLSLPGSGLLTPSLPLKHLAGLSLAGRGLERPACVKPKPCALAQFDKNLCNGRRGTSPSHPKEMGHVFHFLLFPGSLCPSGTSQERESRTGCRVPESSSPIALNTPLLFKALQLIRKRCFISSVVP